jgi:mannitol-1-/sugar-/sorbitol-6-phosphatase
VRFAAVISDLDGVLVDSRAATRRAWAVWAEPLGLDGAAIQAANHGRPARDVVAEHVAPDLVDGEDARLLDIEVTDTRGVVAFPGAVGVMALPVVAIATSCTHPLAVVRVRAAGLPMPAVLVTADQVRHGKPAPDPYLLAASRLGVDPGRCLVLEDAPSGIAAGRAAGMTVWAVTTTHAAAELADAHRIAGALPELLAALVDRSALA